MSFPANMLIRGRGTVQAATDVDCIGRGKFTDKQLMGMVRKVRDQGLLNQESPECDGRGIVVVGGGKYLVHAWAVCRYLRKIGWEEGIQVWHLGREEMPDAERPKFDVLGVELVDAHEVRKNAPMRRLGGWEAKIFAVMNCPWRHVMYLDADCVPVVHPNELFNDVDVQAHGSLFFSDVPRVADNSWGYVFCGLKRLPLEWETGQFIVDKKRLWMGLRWSFWMLEHSETWFQFGYGDKFVIELGVRVSGNPHCLSTDARWEGWGIGQYWKDRMVFAHQMAAKRHEHPWLPSFRECLDEWESAPAVLAATAKPL